MGKIDFEVKEDPMTNGVVVYLRDELIRRAIAELKRTDKSNLAIIADTRKILENGLNINAKSLEAKAMADLAAPLKYEPIGQPAIPNSIVEGKVVLPDIKISEIKIEDLMNDSNNMFRGGMF